MKAIALAALFAVGIALAGVTGASAAPISGNGATIHASLIEKTAYACRRFRTCHWEFGHRVCHWHRVCRHW